ncbi:MAG TPA: BamA/TamA family outer membrane protein [Paludibacter sp.]|nr:BamA/TamA family outer membrane protein [Paludibacter sp.]
MKIRFLSLLSLLVLLLGACNPTKYVPEGEYLLNKASIKIDNKELKNIKFKEYLRQTPNAAVFGAFRMQLRIYSLAGRDTTKWRNRMLKRIGDPPVIYNASLTSLSVKQIQQVLENKGYINAKVQSSVTFKGKKANVKYIINSNIPYRLNQYNVDVKNDTLDGIASDSSKSLIRPNMLFDVDVFNAERQRIASNLRQQGYYNFNKEFLSYSADSTLNAHKVDVTLEMRDNLKSSNDSVNKVIFKRFNIRKVIFNVGADANADLANKVEMDTVQFRDYMLISPKKRFLKLDALVQNTFINPNSLYSDDAVERTYSALNSLGPIKYVNINFKEVDKNLLDCYIVVIPSKTVSLSTELEATYSAGYWGMGGNISTVNRNVFKGAETLSLLFRGAFEKQEVIWAKEYGVQAGLKFPRFILPVGSYDFKRNIHANTEFTSSFSYQDRPSEYTTTNVGGGINYSWNRKQFRHSIQLCNLSYVQIRTEQAFRDSFLNPLKPKFNPYNYNNHLIMAMGYAGSYSSFNANRPMENYSTARYSIETAGNMLYALNNLMGSSKVDGSYKFYKVRYSQYAKTEFNLTHHQIFDKDNRMVYHLGAGVGIPYGNADVIPYEKRFFSGGANSVRGWGESMLGPGTYSRITGSSRDFNQVGDIKLDMNMEYRAKIFSILEGALFLDGGNIWTIKDYETQNGGTFKFNTFMTQIALAYGIGFRLDFSFVIVRLDVGAKLFNPVLSKSDQWRTKPVWDDMALHFAIGYPF